MGIDDTDSVVRMCTTFVAAELASRLEGYDLIGYPRLVRLNPSIPWKTRGNGALCLRLGTGRGQPFQVGEVNGRPLTACPLSGPAVPTEDLRDVCEEVLLELADLEGKDTQPALVVTQSRPPPGLYWKAVRDIVPLEEVESYLSEADFYIAPRGRRGLVGALAAISWRPRDRTYEVLAYRRREVWGTPRRIREEDVKALDERFPTTFNNYDHENRHMAVAPNSPCPVLMGIRGDVPEDLPRALRSVSSEPVERWILFETNQGTDEHLVRRRIGELRPHTSAIVEGVVLDHPRMLPGGHALLRLHDGSTIDCIAYEPTKSFRRVVLQLRPGDRVRAYGSVRETPRSLNLEKLDVLELAMLVSKVSNPPCPVCGKSMKSAGRDSGYRCRRCGTKAREEDARYEVQPRSISPGLYEPPVVARRHISKPLKRILREQPVEALTPP
jgi:tRNA(Ile2)-agmatinylcytidine synthase